MTLAIAIWGAVLATVGILFRLRDTLRDRPSLAVSGHSTITRGGPYFLRVDVANRGRRATTLMEVGLEVSGGKWTANLNDTGDRPTLIIMRLSNEGDVRLLQPGEIASYEKTPTVALYSIDSPMRPYAIDSHGRTTWGRASPFYRWFYNAGWRPANDDPRLHSDRPLYVAPVAPVWHFWKPRALRGSWRRWNDYGTQRWRRTAMRTNMTEREASETAKMASDGG